MIEGAKLSEQRVLTEQQRQAKRDRDRRRHHNRTDEQKEADKARHRRRYHTLTDEQKAAKQAKDRRRWENLSPERKAAKVKAERDLKAKRRRALAEPVPLASQGPCAYTPCHQPAEPGKDLCRKLHSSQWGGAQVRNEWLIKNDGIYDPTAVEAAAHGFRRVRLTWVERLDATRTFLAHYADQPNLRALLAARLGTSTAVAERLIRRIRDEDRSEGAKAA